MQEVQTDPSLSHRFQLRLMRRRRWLKLLLPIAVLLFFLVGFGTARFLGPVAPGPGSPEVTFARAMAVHHEQAVEMALIVRERSTDPTIRALALDITLTQQAQIDQMQGWLAAWNQPLAGTRAPMAGMESMMGMASQQEINALRSLPPSQAENSFLTLMIRHHQGGIMMAREVLAKTQRPEVVRLATAIVASQQSEMRSMQELLQQRKSEPKPAG